MLNTTNLGALLFGNRAFDGLAALADLLYIQDRTADEIHVFNTNTNTLIDQDPGRFGINGLKVSNSSGTTVPLDGGETRYLDLR